MRLMLLMPGILFSLAMPHVGGSESRVPPLPASLPDAAPLRGALPLGFVVHWDEPGTREYVRSGAPSMLVNLFYWHMRDRERQLVDFARAESWLAYLYEHGLTSAVIVDTSIHHTSIPWRSERTRVLDENVVDADGNPTVYSSPLSPEYRRMVDQYIRDLTGWVAAHDSQRRVTMYVNGAEVFWPGTLDFGPLAAANFREWLIERYGSLDTVNRRWNARFERIEDIRPIPVRRIGGGEFGPSRFVPGAVDNGAWVAPLSGVAPGARYAVNAEVRAEVQPFSSVEMLVAWTAPGHPPEHSRAVPADVLRRDWQRLDLEVTAPDWAEAGDLYLHFEGRGEVRWRNPAGRLTAAGIAAFDPPAGPDAPGWGRAVWNGAMDFVVAVGDTGAVLNCSSRSDPFPPADLNAGAYWDDFHTFSMERYAQTMNHWARRIRECDPTRKVMHYLGFILGTLSQWDDLMSTQRADIFLANAPDVDVNGLQLCAANGDFHYATVNLDLARKYGKPMVAADLQDFTHGVYVGFSSLNRTTLACIAHGMTGAYYYCWYDRNIDYNWHGNWPVGETRRMLDQARACIGFLHGAELEARVGFLLPLQPFLAGDPRGDAPDMLDAMGWYKMVCQAGACANVFTPYELARADAPDLGRYAAVVVPDCPVLPAAAADRLNAYVASGGVLVHGGRAPRHDETGAGPDAAGFGTGNDDGPGGQVTEHPRGAGRVVRFGGMAGRRYLGPVRRYRVAGNTPPLYLPDGSGGWPRDEGRPLLQAVHAEFLRADALPVRMPELDPTVEICPHRAGDEWRVVLVHTGPGMHRGGRLLLPGVGPHPPAVLADFEERGVTWELLDNGDGMLTLPVFADSCLVRW